MLIQESASSDKLSIQCAHLVEHLWSLLIPFGFSLKRLPVNESAERFGAEGQARLEEVRGHLETYVDIIREATERDINPIRNDKGLLWVALKRLRLSASCDLLEYVEDGEILEIYDPNRYQLFRNLRFLEISGHMLEDILLRPWSDLFERDPRVTEALYDQCRRVFLGEVQSHEFEGIEDHLVREKRADDLGAMLCRMRLRVGLYSPDARAAKTPSAILTSLRPLGFLPKYDFGRSPRGVATQRPETEAPRT